MKDIIINGKTYEGVSRIAVNTIEGTSYFKDEEEIAGVEITQGVLDLQNKDWASGIFTFAHKCSKAPDLVIINANYGDVFVDGVVPNNTTIIVNGFDKSSAISYMRTIATALNLTQAIAPYPTTNDGYITDVNDENITIKLAASKRLDKRLTYSYKCIVF